MPSKDKITSKNICESCGNEFSCGADTGKCWCFERNLAPETLAELKENFNNCLCEKCLANIVKREAFPSDL